MDKLFISPSPHNYGKDSVKKLMYGVIIALIPSLGFSLFFYGLGALIVIMTSVISCVLFEYLISKFILKQQPTILDGSAVITGLLLGFNVPSNLPIWILIIGALVAIGVAKMTYGGLGKNPFNPALVGRVFMLISFPVPMTLWPLPCENRLSYLDAVTGATPLAIIKEGVKNGQTISQLSDSIPTHLEMFMGNMGGSLGEISALALIIGGIYMLIRKIITWHIPVSVIGSVLIFSGILWLVNPDKYIDPMFHILTGGLLLGAIFMATDYVTSPMSTKGMLIYGCGIGILTILIRVFGAYPEGVSFAILVMNAFTPLINKYIKPKRFGEVKKIKTEQTNKN